jgi:Family of unknown function (DUF6163)
MNDDSHLLPDQSVSELLFVVFLRLVAIVFFIFGIIYWGKLVGYFDNGSVRFDLMPTPVKVASTSLAVLFPVAALGLWLSVSWGEVLWAIAAATEIVMYEFWAGQFEPWPLIPLFHLIVAVIYCVLRGSLWYNAKQKDLKRKE